MKRHPIFDDDEDLGGVMKSDDEDPDDNLHFVETPMDVDAEPETTDEITPDDFYRFKDSLPAGNDWEE